MKVISTHTLEDEDKKVLLENEDNELQLDYPGAVIDYALENIESVNVEMVQREATYGCGTLGHEVSELTFKLRMKEGSLFQPHTGTMEEFLTGCLRSFLSGELNTMIGLGIENPEP